MFAHRAVICFAFALNHLLKEKIKNTQKTKNKNEILIIFM